MEFFKILGVSPRDQKIYGHALTHPSSVQKGGRTDFERLEFLGDRVLGLVIANMLLEKFPSEQEGTLAKRQAALVRKETLRKIADRMELQNHVQANQHDLMSAHSSILPDAVEALMGALFLDLGLAACEDFITHHWAPFFENEKFGKKDAKSALQEWVQKRTGYVPVYEMIHQSGPDHEPDFTVQVDVPKIGIFSGTAKTRRQAEQITAQKALDKIHES